MVSSAIVSVDAWIHQAEEVLAELREQGLSPSSAPPHDPGILATTISFADFAKGLEDVLRALCERPGRWILIAEDASRPDHFWQALAYEDGSLHVELVSNHYLDGDDRLSEGDEEWLETQGWDLPRQPRSPNWSHSEDTTSPEVGEVARQAVEAMRVVFGLVDEDLVLMKLFLSDHRGNSPASPDPSEDLSDVAEELGAGASDTDDWNPYPYPEPDASEDETMAWAMADLGVRLCRQVQAPNWIDPDSGPDEEEPDIWPDLTADDPPFADQEIGVEEVRDSV